MRSLGATFNRAGWRRYAPIALVAVTAIVVLYTLFDVPSMVPWRPRLPNLQTFPVAPLAKACDNIPPPDPNTDAAAAANAPIPNLVHYIWLLADPAVFTLNFKVFVSVYSAHLFFHPDRIYIHTDVSPSLWERAKSSGDLWTKRGEISLDYVLGRRSNYARAVYPAVWHAVKEGIISEAARNG
ncbi:predicted protein [Chaetomium globosum CBS 148.51]|uniref:Uncharacterized protein n=1 Tax=Chaetomium globosum (strain ATCC 6205 / CBS 148.51 / DSM 1962 / NBRC 6347 / NRRL 1970) TaxID=306901 RepID=Q2GTZ2_CHAGB|nr:uncharacterized protein CHGG_08562 [Chaetomium globosum CBS 148.51]EAQ84548.1 predicted protein [Chaetomium globosum CBS 148.51]